MPKGYPKATIYDWFFLVHGGKETISWFIAMYVNFLAFLVRIYRT